MLAKPQGFPRKLGGCAGLDPRLRSAVSAGVGDGERGLRRGLRAPGVGVRPKWVLEYSPSNKRIRYFVSIPYVRTGLWTAHKFCGGGEQNWRSRQRCPPQGSRRIRKRLRWAVLLGIGESEAKPPVADRIVPVQRCAELAERLKLVFRDRVEPQLPRIDVFAVRTDGESGVVIIRVGRSRLAPHRVTKTLVCPVRRSDRCEEMSMREIQDMTLNVSRGLERLERRLSERLERFRQEFKYLQTPEDAWGIRLTAAPVGEEIRLNRVFRQDPASQLGRLAEEFDEPWHQVLSRPQDGKYRKLKGLVSQSCLPEYWKPRLRAARAGLHFDFSREKLYRNSYRELHCDGLIELGYVSRPSVSEGRKTSLSPLATGLGR